MRELSKTNCNFKSVPSHTKFIMENSSILEGNSDFKKWYKHLKSLRPKPQVTTIRHTQVQIQEYQQ